MFILNQKIMFIPQLFVEISQKYCKLILSTLGMLGHINQKPLQQIVGNSDVYLQPKI